MENSKQNRAYFLALIFIFTFSSPVLGESQDPEISSIQKIVEGNGVKSEWNAKESVLKFSLPRNDLKVNASGVEMVPAMGLTAWAAFTRPQNGDHWMVMGDIVLTEGQVNPVMSVALDHGLSVTALHNHFFGDSPKLMFMHIGGSGKGEILANAVKSVFEAVHQSAHTKFPHVSLSPKKSSLKPEKIDGKFGKSGTYKDGVYKIVFGRTTQMEGHSMGNAMGVNTWATFVGSDGKAVVDGDFAMLESEVQPVLKALRAAKINIVAIHNHMVFENPRIVFLHFWGIGSTAELAQGIKAALDSQKM